MRWMSVSCQADIQGCGSFPAETVFLAEGHQVVSGSMDVSAVVSPVFCLLTFFGHKMLLEYWSLFLMFSFKKKKKDCCCCCCCFHGSGWHAFASSVRSHCFALLLTSPYTTPSTSLPVRCAVWAEGVGDQRISVPQPKQAGGKK